MGSLDVCRLLDTVWESWVTWYIHRWGIWLYFSLSFLSPGHKVKSVVYLCLLAFQILSPHWRKWLLSYSLKVRAFFPCSRWRALAFLLHVSRAFLEGPEALPPHAFPSGLLSPLEPGLHCASVACVCARSCQEKSLRGTFKWLSNHFPEAIFDRYGLPRWC